MAENAAQATQVTRDVEVSALPELLARPPRASVTFVVDGGVTVVPARARWSSGTWIIGVRRDAAADLDGREVVAVVDDGPYWFELRGISVRGTACSAEPPSRSASPDLDWYVVEPRRVLAWDYGSLRQA